jgi:hypothetical protein
MGPIAERQTTMNQRKIKLGKQSGINEDAAIAQARANEDVRRKGWKLGVREECAILSAAEQPPSATPPRLIRPQFLVLAVCASLLLLFSLKTPAAKTSVSPRLAQVLADYDRYLETRRAELGDATTAHRRKLAEEKLGKAERAETRKDWAIARQEASALLHLDNDSQSPVYQFCIELLNEFRTQRGE